MNNTHIEIETMMFGDFRVQVWDENNNSLLDREYFCRGLQSALMTAFAIRTLPNFAKLDIYHRDIDDVKLVSSFELEKFDD
jgi:hypothetical protein